MRKPTLLLSLMFAATIATGQKMTITSVNKTKTFQPGSWYEIKTTKVSLNGQLCDRINYEGTFTRKSADSLEMQTGTVRVRNVIGSISVEHDYVYNAKALTTVATRDILYLKHYKSKKAAESKQSWWIVGTSLLLTGALTMLDFYIVDDKSSRNELLVYGGVQIGVGIAITALSSSKRYHFKEKETVWRMK